jgi:hypothetical protein
MNKTNAILFLFLFLFLCSCKQTNNPDKYFLFASDKYLHFQIDQNTKMPQRSVFLFTDQDRNNYLTFQYNNEILIYDISSTDLVRKVKIESEGENGVTSGFLGYNIVDLNRIFISGLYFPTLFLVDSVGHIKQKIDYSKTDDSQSVLPCYFTSAKQMYIVDQVCYLPQLLNPMHQHEMLEKSPICVSVDTANRSVKALPMRYPPLITFADTGTSAGGGADYSKCFNGKEFVYSFNSSDILYRTSPLHEEIEEKVVKSRYIAETKVLRMSSTDALEVMKATCESPAYGDIIYDKYRKVYYRIAYTKTELDHEDHPFDIFFSGRKVFSILILNEDLEIIGETLFPEYTYNSYLYFVLEDGLYLSTSHIKNPNYNDDVLTFQRIDLLEL